MYVIVVYDVHVSRVNEVRRYLKRYLYWTQNSVFEGSLKKSQLLALVNNLEKMIDRRYDSVRIYVIKDKGFINDIINIGIEKGGEPDIIL